MSIYIAATRQNDGKTMVSLGLLYALGKRLNSIGYMKPVGQQYQMVDGKKIDKDAILMKKIFSLKDELSYMSPIAIPRGFTENYILRGKRSVLEGKVRRAYERLKANNDYVLIEGTGHAGVGSVFDMSNSDVALLLKSKVIIVSGGGVGRPIDEIMLNHTKFTSQGVEVLGVIVNKVMHEKYDRIEQFVRKGLARKGVEVLGVVPFEDVLSNPTILELSEDLGGKLICGRRGLTNVVERFVIGDMIGYEAMDYLSGGTLLITPGNREDFIFSALSSWVLGTTDKYHVSGIIATYGKMPSTKLIEVIERANIPLIVVGEDSFSAASRISTMIFKLRAEDEAKIKETEDLIEKYVDIDKIMSMVKG